MKNQMVFALDVELCSGCYACVVACQDQNDDIAQDMAYRTVTYHEKTAGEHFEFNFLSLACMHCGDAPCLMVCPAGAITRDRDTGAVYVNRGLCVGCHSCELACPFGATKFAADGKMAKCDFCYVRQQYGLKPACVHTCTTGALNFGTVEEVTKAKTEKASLVLLQNVNSAG